MAETIEAAPKEPAPKVQHRLIDFIVMVHERADYLEAGEDARQRSFGHRYAANDAEAEKYRALGRFLLLIDARYGEVKSLLSTKPRSGKGR